MVRIMLWVLALVLLVPNVLWALSLRSYEFTGTVTGTDNPNARHVQMGVPFSGSFSYDLDSIVDLGGLSEVKTAFEFNFPRSTVSKPLSYGMYADLNDMTFYEIPSTTGDYFVEDFVISLGELGGSFLMVAGLDHIDAHIRGSFTYGTANAPVPEPATVLLMGVGLVVAAGGWLRRHSS